MEEGLTVNYVEVTDRTKGGEELKKRFNQDKAASVTRTDRQGRKRHHGRATPQQFSSVVGFFIHKGEGARSPRKKERKSQQRDR